jgi:hypothetical protein
MALLVAYDRGDWRAWRYQLSDDLAVIDHRPIPNALGGIRGPDELTAAVQATSMATSRARALAIPAVVPGAAVVRLQVSGVTAEGAEVEFAMLTLHTTDRSRITRVEVFPLDQRESALARLHALTRNAASASPSPSVGVHPSRRRVPPNAVTATRRQGRRTLPSEDFDVWAASLASQFVDVDHISHVTLDRESFIGAARRMLATIETVATDPEPLATLGERHELARVTHHVEGAAIGDRANRIGAAEMVELHITRVNADGLISRIERFRANELPLALARLIEMHAEDEVPPDRRDEHYRLAAGHRDFRWSEDAVAIDHRPAGLGTLRGADAIRGATSAMHGLSVDLQWRLTDLYALTGQTELSEVVAEGHNQEGGWVQLRAVSVNQWGRDGFVHSVDWYLPEQIDEAFVRFDELCGQPAEQSAEPQLQPSGIAVRAGTPPDRRRVRRNAATDAEQGARFLEAGDIETWAATLTDDYVDVDHMAHITTPRPTLLCDFRSWLARGVAVDIEPLASLGERHSLSRHTIRYDAGAPLADHANRTGPVEFIQLSLFRTNSAGLITLGERYSGDNLNSALARLIELHADDELPSSRRHERYAIAQQLRDRRPEWTLDAIQIDHRPASPGTLRGRDNIRGAIAALGGLATYEPWRVADVMALSERTALLELTADGHNDEGGCVQSRVLDILQYGEDGRQQRSELFRPDQIDEAFRRFDELGRGSLEEYLTNQATRQMARILEANLGGNRQAVAALTAENAIIDDRRSIVGHRAEGREAVLGYYRTGFATGVTEVSGVCLATRGDLLHLCHVTVGGPLTKIELLSLDEISEDGRMVCSVVFDPDDQDVAFDELDKRFAAGEAAPFDWLSRAEALVAYNRRDWPAYEAFLSEDVRFVDHRLARFGVQDRAQLLSAMRSISDLVPDAKARILAVPRLTADGLLVVWERTGHDQSGAYVAWREVAVTLMEQGLMRRCESFSLDDLPAALARFDELTGTGE